MPGILLIISLIHKGSFTTTCGFIIGLWVIVIFTINSSCDYEQGFFRYINKIINVIMIVIYAL